MATVTARPIGDTERTGWRRWGLVAFVAIGPLAVAVLRALLPYYTGDSPAAMAAAIASHQAKEPAVLWLSLVAMLTIVPATVVVGRLALARRPVLGGVAMVVALAGFGALPVIALTDLLALSALRAGLPLAAVARLLGQAQGLPVIAIGQLIFVVGHILGIVLLGIALWRAEVLPGWAALSLSVSQPLHAVFALIVPNHLLDGCAWALTAVGFALAAGVNRMASASATEY